ncbi:MAG: recombinase family protein [Acidimicrobiales bacterium]
MAVPVLLRALAVVVVGGLVLAVLRRRGWRGALSDRPHVAFEVGSSAGRLCFGLWVPAGELRLAQPECFTLRTDHPTDPYRLLLATLCDIGSGGAGVVQVLARPAGTRRRRRCRRAVLALRSSRPRSKLVRVVDYRMTKVAHIVIDPERAPHITCAFELYATGEWTLERLVQELARRGLRNRGRRDRPVAPIGVSALANILSNKAYAGIVTWEGIEYPGLHRDNLLTDTDTATFNRVQDLLAAVDAHLAEWQEIPETAMRFATNCAKAYARASAPTRRRFNQAVFTRIDVRDGKITDVGYHPPFDLLFATSEVEYDDVVVLRCHCTKSFSQVNGLPVRLSPPNTVIRRGGGDR